MRANMRQKGLRLWRFVAVWLGISALLGLVVPGTVSAQTSAKVQKLGGGRFMAETVREVPATGLRVLRIDGPANIGGRISIGSRATETVRISLTKVFKAESEDEAGEFERAIAFRVVTAGSSLDIEIDTRRGAPWEGGDKSARVELTITLPEHWDLELSGRFFEFDLAGPFRRVMVDAQYGRIKLSDVAERVELSGSYTTFEMSNVRGEIRARTSYADLIIRDAIPSAERPARLSNQFGSIVGDRFAGALIAETENAPILLDNLVLLGEGSSLRAANALIKAVITEFGNATLEIRNSNSPVTLHVPANLSARLNCEVGIGGSIQTSGLVIQTHAELLNVGRLEGICGAGRGLIDIDISGPGQIGVQGE